MLYRAPVAFVKSGQITHRHGHLIVAMRFYPRFLAKDLIDEYQRVLAPDERLFAEFKATDRQLKDHNRSFDLVQYEDRFQLSAEGHRELARVAQLAEQRDVYLICQCTHDDKCHCDLLLMTARHLYGSATSQIPFPYPKYAKRLIEPKP